VRALLIINPHATAMSGPRAGLAVRELGAQFDLEPMQTRYRGHARELATAAAEQGYDLVVTFGGDGTVNEVVNGLMAVSVPDHSGADARPALATIPGGGANVFARTLGLPADPEGALRKILDAAKSDSRRTIGLGRAVSSAGQRYFTFSAGLGLPAEVVADVERQRASGGKESDLLYMWTAVRHFYTATDRHNPALTLEVAGAPPAGALFLGVVTNSSPWTYVGSRPVQPAPHRDLNSGLDVFGLRRLHTLTTLHALGQMMHTRSRPLAGRDVVTAVALTDLTLRASRPIAFHIDGEYLGETEKVAFRHLPDALSVFA
jgi:diacylglycerol kinase family enzyme